MQGSTCVSKRRDEILQELVRRQVLFSCEGTAEKVIIGLLANAGRLVVPQESIVRDMDGNPCTTLRRAKDIQREFLDVDYPDGLLIARIVDVNPGVFKLDRLYRRQDIMVRDFVSRPEIESLILVREGSYNEFQTRRGADRQLNASDWCIQRLGMKNVKTERFLVDYWSDADVLEGCVRKLHGMQSSEGGQLGLVDLLK